MTRLPVPVTMLILRSLFTYPPIEKHHLGREASSSPSAVMTNSCGVYQLDAQSVAVAGPEGCPVLVA